jgi:hypothetical protein
MHGYVSAHSADEPSRFAGVRVGALAAIEVNGLCRTYRSRKGVVRRRRTEVHALRGISFEVERGELFGLLGPNGAKRGSGSRLRRCRARAIAEPLRASVQQLRWPHLLGREALVGCAYLVIGITALRVLEYAGRRSAALETF